MDFHIGLVKTACSSFSTFMPGVVVLCGLHGDHLSNPGTQYGQSVHKVLEKGLLVIFQTTVTKRYTTYKNQCMDIPV